MHQPTPPTGQPATLELDGSQLTWRDLERILRQEELTVVLAERARRHMQQIRAQALEILENSQHQRIYGWNQALGPLKNRSLSLDQQKKFQQNVLLSHHVGVGRALDAPVARLALVIRANALARGTAGVRPELVDRLLQVVNSGFVPLMPSTGSLGTGDLQPMAAAGLALIGDEKAQLLGPAGTLSAGEAYRQAGLDATFELEAGEAIALISGSAVLSASLAEAVRRVREQVDVFLGGFALFCEASRAEKHAFDLRLHRERNIPAEEEVARDILALIGDSHWGTATGRLRAGELDPRIQDSTSVRSVPHQLAAVIQELDRACEELTREVNASTCNPIVVPALDGQGVEFISGGNWDGTLLGHTAHSLNVCITRLAVLAKDLAGRLTYEGWSYGLPPSLSGGQLGLNSGMTLVHATGAALIPEMQVRANPVGTLSFPLKGGQEDHNTMAMAGVKNLLSNIRRFDTLLAVLLVMSAQGMHLLQHLMKTLEPGSGSQAIYLSLRTYIAPLVEDRSLADDLERATELVSNGLLAHKIRELIDQGRTVSEGNYII